MKISLLFVVLFCKLNSQRETEFEEKSNKISTRQKRIDRFRCHKKTKTRRKTTTTTTRSIDAQGKCWSTKRNALRFVQNNSAPRPGKSRVLKWIENFLATLWFPTLCTTFDETNENVINGTDRSRNVVLHRRATTIAERTQNDQVKTNVRLRGTNNRRRVLSKSINFFR